MIGIIIPTENEARGIYRKDGIPYIISGAGKINATIAAMDLILNYKVDKILCLGTCGALDNTPIGTVINATDFFQHDMDCTKLGYKYGQCIGEESAWVSKPENGKKRVSIASGDKVAWSILDIALIYNHFKISYVDMESYAIAKVCKKYGKDFEIIKVVTDNQKHLGDWLTNLETALDNLNDAVKEIL